MPILFVPILPRCPRPIAASRRWCQAAMLLIGPLTATAAVAAPPAPLAGSGVATVPDDAAFLFSSLRLREQYNRLIGSNAYAAIRSLPAVKRALASWEEQREMPGSPVSMFLTFLELPENAQAVELLADMASTDTFLYGESSCVAFATLLRKLQQAQLAGQLVDEAAVPALERLEPIEEDGGEAAHGRVRIVPVARQVELDVPAGAGQAEAMLQALADNLDLIVMPDLVWGFKTSKKEAGDFQLKRIEVLARMLVELNPDLAGALGRKRVAGGGLVTFTLDGSLLPWDQIAADLADQVGGSAALDKVLDRIRQLDLVVALGVVGDWVILSVGDSVDHLDKLVTAAPKGQGKAGQALVESAPLAPLRADADRKLTSIWYVSKPMAEAVAARADNLDPMVAAVRAAMDRAGDVPADAAADAKAWMGRARAEYAKWLPEPGPWMAYSFLSDDGYEGYAWDWSKNLPLDAGARLGLLEHGGGNPIAIAVSRLRSDPVRTAAVADLLAEGWRLFVKLAVPTLDGAAREKFDAFNEHVAPLGTTLARILSGTIAPALADGQVGLVLDAKAKTDRLQKALPASSEPLPILEPAIVLPLKDRKLFVSGLNDLFALGDKLVVALRRIDPTAVPAGYRIPDPEKSNVDGGTVWAFALPNAGVDEQVKPAIAVSDSAVAFTLVPGQAARILSACKLETAADVSDFARPLAAAGALDGPALIDALEPWIVYLTRYGSVQQRDGFVNPDRKLSADDETAEATEALEHVDVILDAARCLKAAAADTSLRDGAAVTHWRNIIRDMPKK